MFNGYNPFTWTEMIHWIDPIVRNHNDLELLNRTDLSLSLADCRSVVSRAKEWSTVASSIARYVNSAWSQDTNILWVISVLYKIYRRSWYRVSRVKLQFFIQGFVFEKISYEAAYTSFSLLFNCTRWNFIVGFSRKRSLVSTITILHFRLTFARWISASLFLPRFSVHDVYTYTRTYMELIIKF